MGGLPRTAAARPPLPWAAAAAALALLLLLAARSRRPAGDTAIVQLLAHAPASTASGIPVCTRAEAAQQAAKFKAKLAKEGLYAACPDHKWLSLLPGAMGPNQEFVMIDIGCNKGYESAALFSTLDPDAGVSPERVHEALEAARERLKLGKTEGQCGDHKKKAVAAAPLPAGLGAVTIHCFEPSGSNFRGLQMLREKFFGGDASRSRSSWHLHNMAVTNVSGTVKFPTDCNTELCSLGGDAADPTQKKWTEVKATSVDDFARANGLLAPKSSRALLLKIDTEGFDPAVLGGARKLLSLQVPSVVLFEYHGKQLWEKTSLKDVTYDLAAAGYACYFDGAPTLTRITGCWDDALEIKAWSNVVCAPMGSRYHRLLESLSFMADRGTRRRGRRLE